MSDSTELMLKHIRAHLETACRVKTDVIECCGASIAEAAKLLQIEPKPAGR